MIHKYNTFLVQNCKTGRAILVTSSAFKARGMLRKGRRIEVWSGNEKIATIYDRTRKSLYPYLATETDYRRRKQLAAEVRNIAQNITRA